MRRKVGKSDEVLKNVLSIVSIALVAFLLIVLFKLKGGILGMVLGTIAVAALIYWLMEIKKIFKEQKAPTSEEHEWFYDLIEEEENITFIAKVPGPAREVKAKIVDDLLEIKGGGNFIQKVEIPKGTRLQDRSYINGVLHVKLQKTKTLNNKISSK